MQITITGQLSLLMLIEAFEENGITVVSANTDGIVVKMKKSDLGKCEDLVLDWEIQTGYDMEDTPYNGLYSRDVNNYAAIKIDGSAKTKGAYTNSGLRNNPTNEICKIAVANYLKNETPIIDTVTSCTDITKFVCVRKVNGGAMYEGELIGKAIRWYYAKDELGAMYYKTSGNQVPKSIGAKPLMELPETLPTDIDYEWYIEEANKMLTLTGKNT